MPIRPIPIRTDRRSSNKQYARTGVRAYSYNIENVEQGKNFSQNHLKIPQIKKIFIFTL